MLRGGGGGGAGLYCFVDEQLRLVTCLKPRIGSPRKHDRDDGDENENVKKGIG